MLRRLLTVMAVLTACLSLVATSAAPAGADPADRGRGRRRTHFDLQAHRGGLGLTTESTIEGFAKALRIGVTTLELDTQITKDQRVVITHDRQVSAQKCKDTGPVEPGDPMYPYVGKYIKDLTLAQIHTMNCGYQQLPGYPQQEQIDGARMPELWELFALIHVTGSWHVKMNIETKVEAGAPEQTAPRELFVRRVAEEIYRGGVAHQVTIQSFDWGALMAMHRIAPRLPLVALTNYDFLQVGKPGASPWLGGIDVDDFGGDLVAAVRSIPGVVAISPVQGFPQNGTIGDPGFRPYPDRKMIDDAHRAGLKVIPWTIDDPATMGYFIDLGVDGIITNYPDRLRQVMAERRLRLPWGCWYC